MDKEKINQMLVQEINLTHSILENTNFNMDLFSLIDRVLSELLSHFKYNRVNVVIINENDKAVIHDVYARLFPQMNQDEKDFLQPRFETEIDYRENNMWVCVAIKEDREFYIPEIDIEKMPEDSRNFFKLTRIQSLYVLPIKQGKQIFGSLYLANTEPLYLDETEKNYIRRIGSLICKILLSYRLYQKIKLQNVQFETELKLASNIQTEILSGKLPRNSRLLMDSVYIPMQKVGGDFFDFIYQAGDNENRFGLIIADVSGHGVPAAFITSMLKICFQSDAVKEKIDQPAEVLKKINDTVSGKTAGNFITAFYAYFDLEQSVMKYSSAGHNPFFLINLENGEINELNSKGKFLGLFKDLNLEEKTIQLCKNRRFLFFTDGLTEASTKDGLMFEDKIHAILKNTTALPPVEFSKLLVSELKSQADFEHKKEFEDDIAFIVMDIKN